MEIKRLLCGISCFLILAVTSYAQQPSEKTADAYVYFDEYDDGEMAMYKLERKDTNEPDIYIYGTENGSKLPFNTVDKENHKIVDSCFIKKLDLKNPKWGANSDNYGLDLNSVSTKYRHIFFVDKLAENEYKIVEVVPYIGSIFFAPGYPKRKTGPRQ